MTLRFFSPWILLLIPIILYLYNRKYPVFATIKFSDIRYFKRLIDKKKSNSGKNKIRILQYIRIIAIVLLIVALARPQGGVSFKEINTHGVDIVISIDVSSSMLGEDLRPKTSRLQVAKEVALDFIKKRRNDRIGLTAFARRAYTQCPLTLDYNILKSFMDMMKIGMIEDGTAIGSGVAVSLARIKKGKAKSKVVILLTDGVNNAGNINPLTAANLAKSLGIKIYTIGLGTDGYALYPYDDQFFGRRYVKQKVEIDEELLEKIADITGGFYFRAKDEDSLRNIYDHINKLEKSEIKSKEYTLYSELYHYFLYVALLMIFLEIILSCFVWIKIP